MFGFLEGKDFGIPWFRNPNDRSHKADGTPTIPIVPAVSWAGFPIIIGPNTGVCSFSEMMLYNRSLTLDEVKQVSSYMVKENGMGILQGL